MITSVYAHILDEDRKINAQKFESAFYAKPDLRAVRPPEEPKEPAPATLDLEALVEQLRQSPELAKYPSCAALGGTRRQVSPKTPISKDGIFLSRNVEIVRFFLAGYTLQHIKFSRSQTSKRPGEAKQKNAANQQKMACSGAFGTPGWVRTSGLSLRRRPLYPTELRGLIQKIFNFRSSRIRTNCRLGGGPSILVRYGGIYRNYSILQGSRIRTIRFLGGGRSIQLSYGGMWVSGLWCRRMGTVSFYPVPAVCQRWK